MAFRDNIAPQRVNPTGIPESVAPALASASTQMRSQGQAAKFSTVSTAPNVGVSTGDQLRVQGNTKGTGVVGKPSSLGNKGRDFMKPATANPSGSGNQTTAGFR